MIYQGKACDYEDSKHEGWAMLVRAALCLSLEIGI